MELKLIHRRCPICNSASSSHVYSDADFDVSRMGQFAFASRKLPEYMHYRLLLCKTCDLLYADPIPDPNLLACRYESAAYDSATESEYAAQTYATLLDKIIRMLPDRAGAVDIGAGDGAFLSRLLDRGFSNVVGIEPSSAPIAVADAHVKPLIRHGGFSSNQFPIGQFSLVCCFQTLEHLCDPLQVCRSVFGMLRMGGAFLCVIHNWRALSARTLGLKSPIYDIEHLQLFSRRSIRLLLEAAGFREVRTRILWNCYPMSYWLRLFPLPGRSKDIAATAARAIGASRVPITLPAGNLAVVGFNRVSMRRSTEDW